MAGGVGGQLYPYLGRGGLPGFIASHARALSLSLARLLVLYISGPLLSRSPSFLLHLPHPLRSCPHTLPSADADPLSLSLTRSLSHILFPPPPHCLSPPPTPTQDMAASYHEIKYDELFLLHAPDDDHQVFLFED